MTPTFQNEIRKSCLQVATVSGNMRVSIPATPAKDCGFFPHSAKYEVIVYFPTGGFLGDDSVSAKR